MSEDREDEQVLGEELERRTPAPDPGWSDGLARQLEDERRRRAVMTRPTHLRLRVLGAAAVGTALLLLALAQV